MVERTNDEAVGFAGLEAFGKDISPALSEADRLAELQPAATDYQHEDSAPATADHDWGTLGRLGQGLKGLIGIAVSIFVIVALKACMHAAFSSDATAPPNDSQPYTTSSDDPQVPTETAQAHDSTVAKGSRTEDDLATSSSSDVADNVSNADTSEVAVDGSAERLPNADLGSTYDAEEIRYCMSEDARLDGARAYMDELQVSDHTEFNRVVDRYNGMASNYNSRCSHFRGSADLMDSIKSEVQSRRISLEQEGRNRLQ